MGEAMQVRLVVGEQIVAGRRVDARVIMERGEALVTDRPADRRAMAEAAFDAGVAVGRQELLPLAIPILRGLRWAPDVLAGG